LFGFNGLQAGGGAFLALLLVQRQLPRPQRGQFGAGLVAHVL